MLKISKVNKGFGGRTVLKNVSLVVQNGDIVGLLGKNGAGKSTLIKCINQLYKFQGDIRVNGVSYRENPSAYLKNVGILLEPSYYDYMTAMDNLRAYASLNGTRFTDVESEIKELLDVIGLGDAMQKQVKEFSFGMKQKLGVAMALVKKPDVLVLDEPTIGVDPKGLEAMFDILRSLAVKHNIAIIFSSNNLKEVQDVSNKISFLKDGEIVQTIETSKMLDLENSYTVSVRNPISPELRVDLEENRNVVVGETKISINNYENLNRVIKVLVKYDNPILDIERENKFLRDFYD